MEVRNCKNCGRLFNYIGGSYFNLCPECIDELEKVFQEVKKHVEENPGTTINEITEIFNISSRQVEKWIRDERLVFADDSPIGIPCEKCGITIKSGKYCSNCLNEMGTQMRNLYRAVTEPTKKLSSGNKMRFLDNKQ